MSTMMWALAQVGTDGSEYPTSEAAGPMAALFGGAFFIVWLVVVVAMIAGMWKVFEKAGEPGWAAVVPIYNMVVLTKIAGRPVWWVVLMLLPCANIVAWVMISLDVARKFGQTTVFAVGLILLPFVFYPMLGFGEARYNPAA